MDSLHVVHHDQQSDVRDGMRIDWNVPIEMDDGVVLRADVFRPVLDGRYPPILSCGPYGKGVTYEGARGTGLPYALLWDSMRREFPEIAAHSSNKYQVFETIDPERWVPGGYVCVRIDSRGSGRSEGVLDVWSLRQTRDLYQSVEWAARQPWSNGKVGMAGTSYHALNQWQVAALRPPHLAAIVPMEGMADPYREAIRHGGILSRQLKGWFAVQVAGLQHGNAAAPINPNTGERASGPDTIADEELRRRRVGFWGEIERRILADAWYRERSAFYNAAESGDWSRIVTPLLSVGNWNSHAVHLRGNVEGFMHAASEQKWLDIHGGSPVVALLGDRGTRLQKRFFDHFLKGIDNGWPTAPRVRLEVRRVDGPPVVRHASEFPLPQTRWTSYYLDASARCLQLAPGPDASIAYRGLSDGVRFLTDAFAVETEITGPLMAKLWISSSTADADIFAALEVIDPRGQQVEFREPGAEAFLNVWGGARPPAPLAEGWLRASHRKLDPARSLPYRPYHTHDELQPLTPGAVYRLDVEIWPTSVLLPPGYRLALHLSGKDWGLHRDPHDRPEALFDGEVTIHTGASTPSELLLPVIPAA